MFCISVTVYAATTFTVDGIEYTSSTAGIASVKSGTACSGDVVIPDTVVYDSVSYEVSTISASAFKSNKSITSITIPKTITSIGSSAFSGCTGLLSVKWNAVKCSNFTSTATSQPFNGLTNITSIEFGDEVKTVPAYLCNGLSGLNGTLVIPDAVNSIGTYAFSGCSKLDSVYIGKALTTISQYAFKGCTELLSVKWNAAKCSNFTSTATSRPFNGLTNITSIDFGNDVRSIPAYLCHGLTGLNCTLAIPDSVTTIGAYAFYNCSGLNGSLVIPDRVTSIGTYTFYKCSGLNSVTIGNAVTSIGAYAFNGCSDLNSVTIGNAVTSIGNYAFTGCSGLLSVKWNAVKCGNFTSTVSSQPFNALTNITSIEFDDAVKTIPAYMCYGLTGLSGSLVIPDKVTTVGSNAFYNCSHLNNVTVGKAVTSIGENAFTKCTGLVSVKWNAVNCPDFTSTASKRPFNGLTNISSIEFGDAVKTIPAYLCYGLTGLNCTLAIPDSVAAIGNYAFYNCSGLNGALVIPDAVTSIGNYAFYGCSGLNGELVLSSALTSIGTYVFYNCSGLNGTLVIPDSVTSIGTYSFNGCSGLDNLTIGKAVTSIGTYAFAGCTGLASVRWNAKNCADFTTTSGSQPFSGLTNITSIEFDDEITTVPAYLCNGLTNLNCPLDIPDSVITIGSHAFYNCKLLNNVTIGKSVTTIGSYSFYGCSGLNNKLIIPSSVTSIERGAFYGCSGITKVILEDGSNELDNDYASYTYSGGDPYAGYGYEGSSSCTYTFNSCNVDSIYIGRKVKDYLFGSNSSSWGNGSDVTNYGKNTKVKTVIYSRNQRYLEKLCTGIETLTFLESVTSLSSSNIASTALRDVYVYWLDPPTIAESFFTTTAYNNAILHVPEGTSDTYRSRAGWKNFTIVENVPSFVVGDVDGDGILTISDICKLIDILLMGDASTIDMRIYDTNNNNKLDMADIILLIDMLLGI